MILRQPPGKSTVRPIRNGSPGLCGQRHESWRTMAAATQARPGPSSWFAISPPLCGADPGDGRGEPAQRILAKR